ncbi:STAS/SEC14 domain-containing protein [Roseobacter sp. YSTF-M11]|uniref:STAS/SEC14 domain-containing protein n=1 Tax=Roseobacter insulae TaxID=2859783 RepID=A0A9X1FTE6_9RHOB|nr:STAS/SEC14 domain-containing protein [Roseobacter insulae]MBW4707454.1 STAS/SEC14 domain-containing protein [Roseobacter insulae]
MTRFSYGPITQIPTTSPNVYAFRIKGHVDDDASEALAKFMNDVFDRQDKVNMLMDLSAFTGSDWDAMLDGDVLESRFRALKHVDRYAVIGAPDRAKKMIGLMDKIIPVEAKAFEVSGYSDAWTFVGAKSAEAS